MSDGDEYEEVPGEVPAVSYRVVREGFLEEVIFK